jgi:Subtilase family
VDRNAVKRFPSGRACLRSIGTALFRLTKTFLIVGILLASAQGSLIRSGPRSGDTMRRLSLDSRIELAAIRASGERVVSMVFAAKPGQASELIASVQRFGGEVRFRDDKVDYVHARIPVGALDRVLDSRAIEAAAVDIDLRRCMKYIEPGPGFSAGPTYGSPRVPSAVGEEPLLHPYLPQKALRYDVFERECSGCDGRGATIALVESVPDLLLPEFRFATSLDGKSIDKFADIKTATNPVDDPSYAWVKMSDTVIAVEERAQYEGKTYIVPHPGTFQMGVFEEPSAGGDEGSEFGWDIDFTGRPPGHDGRFTLLWDQNSNEVWVDTDRDGDFAKHKPLTDYSVKHDIGIFGHDDPSSPVRKTIGFTVQTDKQNGFVRLNLGVDFHASLNLNPAANGGMKGRYTGIAPGAQYEAIDSGYSTHATVEALIAATEDAKVDVVLWEDFTYLDRMYLMQDGRQIQSIIAERLVKTFEKPIIATGGNQAGLGLVYEQGVAPDVMSIGAYQSKESYLRNFGIAVREEDNLQAGGLGHGPAGNGGMKPDVLAPAGQLGNFNGYVYPDERPNGWSMLPSGYDIGGGTSQAAPAAAGAYALLISGAKQKHFPYEASKLNYAVRNSARYLPNYPAYEQGNGLIDVAAAWNLLQKLPPGIPLEIESEAPIRTVNSAFLVEPDRGVGIYEREGWLPGSTGLRNITLTRISGPATAIALECHWIGNDGTFSGPDSIGLALDTPTEFPVHIRAATAGAHSAILACSAPGWPADLIRILNTIVAAEDLGSAPERQIQDSLLVKRPGDGSVFVTVPQNAGKLSVTSVSTGNDIEWTRAIEPSGIQRDPRTSFDNPAPGVWEVVVYNNRDIFEYVENRPSPVPDTPVQISVRLEESHSRAALAHTVNGAVKGKRQWTFDIGVPAKSSSLLVRLNSNDPDAALDLALVECTKGPCRRAEQGAALVVGRHVPTKELHIEKPAAGRWVAVVDAFSVSPQDTVPFTLGYEVEPQ